jgi:hypothetical protein
MYLGASTPKAPLTTKGEVVCWWGLFHAACLFTQRGHDLVAPPAVPLAFTVHPGLEKYMTKRRFDNIKRAMPTAFRNRESTTLGTKFALS